MAELDTDHKTRKLGGNGLTRMKAWEMAHVPHRHARRADAVDHRQRTVDLRHRLAGRRELGLRQPDVLPRGARRDAGRFGQDIAEDVVDEVRPALWFSAER
jgi:hypothetical protein